MKITVEAGPHTRKLCPVAVKVSAEAVKALSDDGKGLVLKPENGRQIPCACRFEGEEAELSFILDWLGENECAEFELSRGKVCDRMRTVRTERGLSILSGEDEITEYYTKTDIPKPYLGHLRERYGTPVTRLDPTTKEHPHHRALWISHGDVNGVDTWNEPKDTHGFIRVRELSDLFDSPVWTGFTAHNVWTDHGGKPLCNEDTSFRIYDMPGSLTVIDVDITLSAAYGEVTLGPTKEAGPLAVRMADELIVQHTGTMESAEGGINEGEIWMKRSAWVDYWGTTAGRRCGVAVFDNAENELFPTYWHARNYGLMAVNNFYRGGARVIPEGESKNWKFRVIAHSGSTAEAEISKRYLDYFAPPKIKAE
ncbi:MAG: PmoA family protein [Clostridiales bacterium]|nr:PmoA family protein [Clostridiales bacterium]